MRLTEEARGGEGLPDHLVHRVVDALFTAQSSP